MKIFFKYIFGVSLLLLILSCSEQSDTNKLSLGGLDSYILDKEKETELSITSDVFHLYDSISGNYGKLSIPLQRVVQGDNYIIYIGLPLNTTNEEIKSYILDIKKSSKKLKSLSKFRDLFIYRSLVVNKSSKRKYLFILTSKDSDLVAKLFRKDLALKKIKFSK